MTGYQLIDFGNARRLDWLAGYVVDRPCPAAADARPSLPPQRWQAADARYHADARQWTFRKPWPSDLRMACGDFWLPFHPKPFGHIGCFPEQQPHWQWLQAFVHHATLLPTGMNSVPQPSQQGGIQNPVTADPDGLVGERGDLPSCLEALNLFAHTGGSSLAMVSGGARATHVDAAKPSVAAARAIASEQPPADRQIRFLVEDAARYVAREVRRGRRYTVVALDPPSYGHAPSGGRSWRIERDLWPLLDDCLTLLRGPSTALLVTGHSVSPDQHAIAEYLRQARPADAAGNRLELTSGRSRLLDQSGRPLDAGFFVRAVWSAGLG